MFFDKSLCYAVFSVCVYACPTNVGIIPNFDNLIAFMRSKEISVNVILQTLTQLKTMYEKSHETIVGNCDSFLFLGGPELTTREQISKDLGKETIDLKTQNQSKGKSGGSSENNSILGRELLTPDELKVMPTDECILMCRANYPYYGKKFDIESHPNYKYLEDYDPKNAYDYSKIKTEKIVGNEMSSEILISENADNGVEISVNDNSEQEENMEKETNNEVEIFGEDEEVDPNMTKLLATAEPCVIDADEEITDPDDVPF